MNLFTYLFKENTFFFNQFLQYNLSDFVMHNIITAIPTSYSLRQLDNPQQKLSGFTDFWM